MIVVIDNYDSFVYNLVQYIGHFYQEIEVYRNDRITVDEVIEKNPKGIVISPGPKGPEDAGISVELIRKAGPHIPILGVCLGHQSIGYAYGGRVVVSQEIYHGKISEIEIRTPHWIFEGLPSSFSVVRYHSLVVAPKGFPKELEILAKTGKGIIMALCHKQHPHIVGLQFHPESIKTEYGLEIIKNFLKKCGCLGPESAP